MNNIPDTTTIAFFREHLRKASVIEDLFEMFEAYLRSKGLEARGGQIIDATLVPVPKQRNTREENKEIKSGRPPEGWDENQDRLRQKDLDARWVKRMGSITTDTRTVSVLMLTMASSVDMPHPLPIFMTARCLRGCLILKRSTTMVGRIRPMQENSMRSY